MLQHTLASLAKQSEAHLHYLNHFFTNTQLVIRCQEILSQINPHKLHRIAFCLPNSPEFLCWQIACFHAGIPIIPIIYDHDAKFIEEVIALTHPSLLITTSKKLQELNKSKIDLSCPTQLIDDEMEKIAAIKTTDELKPLTRSRVKSNELAIIIFSSGTTGTLKGIMHSYESFFAFMDILIEILLIKEKCVYIVAQPMGHIGGISTSLMTLLNNGTVILLKQFLIDDFLQAIDSFNPTHLNLHTPLFYQILNAPNIKKEHFANIICAFAGGDDIPSELPTQFTKKTGAPMRIGYGMSEIGIVIVNPAPYKKYATSCGKKISRVEIKIMKDKKPLTQPHQIGEMVVSSPACCLGYWNEPALNKTTLKNGWFYTGDLAYRDDDGYFWYMGRVTEAIHNGEQIIFPKTIEQLLFNCPEIESAAVVGIKEKSGKELPVAFVELKPHVHDPNVPNELLACLNQHLDAWETPKHIIILKKMPLNLTGKIDREKLKKMFTIEKI